MFNIDLVAMFTIESIYENHPFRKEASMLLIAGQGLPANEPINKDSMDQVSKGAVGIEEFRQRSLRIEEPQGREVTEQID